MPAGTELYLLGSQPQEKRTIICNHTGSETEYVRSLVRIQPGPYLTFFDLRCLA
jgi:hypothetical protein